MAKQSEAVVTGEILSENLTISFIDFCHTSGVTPEIVIELVEYGLVEPIGRSPEQWQFTIISLWRFQTALRLHRDLKIDYPGVALALDLLEEVRRLRQRVKSLEGQLSERIIK